jgi:hypothetical protein
MATPLGDLLGDGASPDLWPVSLEALRRKACVDVLQERALLGLRFQLAGAFSTLFGGLLGGLSGLPSLLLLIGELLFC